MIRILKLWEGKYSMWNTKSVLLFIASLVAVIFISMSMANAEDNKLSINEIPNKVGNFVNGEIEKTKEYQKKTWAEAKTKWPWNVIFKDKK
jgi:ABC-type phosphate/phosphonate transport system permease subunit